MDTMPSTLQQAIAENKMPYEIIGIAPEIYSQLPPIAQGWVGMCAVKVETFKALEHDELAIQAALNGIDALCITKEGDTVEGLTANLTKVQEILATNKTLAATSKDQRLFFTNTLDEKLMKPAMAFEKRSILLINVAELKELNLRRHVERMQAVAQHKTNEIAELKTHLINEYYRIAAKYRVELRTLVVGSYNTALDQRQDVANIKKYKETIVEFLKELQLDLFEKKTRLYVTDDEAGEIFQSVPAYDGKDDLAAAIKSLDDQFAMYAEDLQNAAAAMNAQSERLQEQNKSEAKDLEITIATNNLVSNVGTEIDFGGSAKVKRKMDVVIENSDVWASGVMSAFQKNWDEVVKYISVKEWGNLAIKQMAAALGKLATDRGQTSTQPGKVFMALTLKVVEK